MVETPRDRMSEAAMSAEETDSMPAAAPEDDFEWHDADTSAPAAPEAPSAASEQAAIAPGSFDDDDDDFGDFDGAPSAWAAAPAAPAPASAPDIGASTSTSVPAVPLTPMQPAAAAPAPASPAAPSTAALGIPTDPDLLALSDDDFRRAVATAWLAGGSTTSRTATAEAAQQLLDQARRRLLPSGAEPGSVLFHAGVPMASASLPQATPSPLPTPAPTPTSARPPLGRPSLPSVGSMSNLGPTLVWKGPLGQVYQPVARSTSQMHWCGSESEQRLLSSLGLWDLAQQVLEAEAVRQQEVLGAGTGAMHSVSSVEESEGAPAKPTLQDLQPTPTGVTS